MSTGPLLVKQATGFDPGAVALARIGPKSAAEIVNLASAGMRHGLAAHELADLSPVHPSASEALVQVLQERFDRIH